MKNRIFSNMSLFFGIVSWIILIINITFYFITVKIEFTGLLLIIMYGVFVVLLISFFASVLLSVTGIIFALIYFKRNKKIKLLLLNIIINSLYVIIYVFIINILAKVGISL